MLEFFIIVRLLSFFSQISLGPDEDLKDKKCLKERKKTQQNTKIKIGIGRDISERVGFIRTTITISIRTTLEVSEQKNTKKS